MNAPLFKLYSKPVPTKLSANMVIVPELLALQLRSVDAVIVAVKALPASTILEMSVVQSLP